MKQLILLNPSRSRRMRASRRRSRRKSHRRRFRIRRNPVRARRRRSRRRSTSLVVSSGFAPIRARRRRSARRVGRRRGGRRSAAVSLGGRGLLDALMSRQTLALAGGAIGASLVTSVGLRQFGAQLPLANSLVGRVGYKLAFPALGSLVVRRFNRDLAAGFLVGGVILAANDLLAAFAPKTAAAVRAVGEYAGLADPASADFMSYGDGDDYSAYAEGDDELGEYFEDSPELETGRLYDTQPAFGESNWG